MSVQPLTIVAAPFEIWIAPVGESFPLIDAAPAGNWVKLGTSGVYSMSEDGVTIQKNQTISPVYVLGMTTPIKAFRSQETLQISFTLFDITLENYKNLINGGTVTDSPESSGVAGYRSLDLVGGFDVFQRALLARGLKGSPYLADVHCQYQIPVVYQNSSPSVVYKKDAPAGLSFEYMALADPSRANDLKAFGTFIAEDAAAT